MILYYAPGGGLGHLTRARAFLHTMAFKDRAAILTPSPFAKDPRVTGGAEIIPVPKELAGDLPRYKSWLRESFARLRPDGIYLDAFPVGIMGEFCDFQFPAPVYHIARLLRWTEYAKLLTGAPPTFHTTYRVEPLVEEQERFLRNHSLEIATLDLQYPYESLGDHVEELIKDFTRTGRPLWLIVHSGPDRETEELIAYADEMRGIEEKSLPTEEGHPQIILVAPHGSEHLREGISHIDIYPASALFPFADRVITACGFNALRETEAFQARHRYIPFARRYDDQFLRARARKRDEAGERGSRGAGEP
ncbi:MAG: hypothetical protein L0229_20920 [Blastocatellia bacterium]|nr:hypothetical protein [Blastocatellia bacterium]